jgi:glycosyltransferase involved in cell wall biosynthesis
VHVVVPEGIDDPAQPSGGNIYDRHLCRGLGTLGWSVQEHASSAAGLGAVVEALPDDAITLIDGLLASPAPDVLASHARRLRIVVLVHMALGDEGERVVLTQAAAVITTSAWSRRHLLALHDMRADRVHVAEPGVEPAEPARGTPAGGELLCVAAVIPGKGHDVLLDALAQISDLSWRCTCVGSLERDPAFVHGLDRGRAQFAGPLAKVALDRCYARADALVLASRGESYGMVVTEALARGLPVIATEVGGVPEALGHGADGIRPGLLVAPGDPSAFVTALRDWLEDEALRARLRRAAGERRASLTSWAATAAAVAGVLCEVAR